MTTFEHADDALAASVMQQPPEFTFEPPPETFPEAPAEEFGGAIAIAGDPEPASDEQADEDDYTPRPFDERYKQPLTGLLYIGYLDDTVELLGHTFDLQTPSTTDRLAVALVTKEYADTFAVDFAYAVAIVAAYLIRVDQSPLPVAGAFKDPQDVPLRHKFRWVMDNLRKPVIDVLFQRTLVLDNEVAETMAAMGKASG